MNNISKDDHNNLQNVLPLKEVWRNADKIVMNMLLKGKEKLLGKNGETRKEIIILYPKCTIKYDNIDNDICFFGQTRTISSHWITKQQSVQQDSNMRTRGKRLKNINKCIIIIFSV